MLRKCDAPPTCPYGKKCTYGNKCKFHHPERGTGPHKSITERLSEHAARHISARNLESLNNKTALQGKSLSVPLNSSSGETSPVSPGSGSSSSTTGGSAIGQDRRRALCRTRSGMPDISFSGPLSTGHPQRKAITGSSHLPTGGFAGEYSYDGRQNDSYPQQVSCYPNSNVWQQQQQLHHQQQQQQQIQHQHCQQQQQQEDCSNLHQKLQRQLTLNPAGLDPRIGRMQQQQPHSIHHQHQLSPHRPLAPSLSGPHQAHLSHQVSLILIFTNESDNY